MLVLTHWTKAIMKLVFINYITIIAIIKITYFTFNLKLFSSKHTLHSLISCFVNNTFEYSVSEQLCPQKSKQVLHK